jgi:hypothetical protein
LLLALPAHAQQLPDATADVSVATPAFAKDTGPRVVIDGAHHNFHKVDGNFKPFADLLRNDGFPVAGSDAAFTKDTLANVKILVIANALNPANDPKWELPTPSAFTPAEIAAVKRWVQDGGALLLIADHMPFAGAAQDLAKEFGFDYVNGFAFRMPGPRAGDAFIRADGTLKGDPLTAEIDRLVSFTGSAFTAPRGARTLFAFGKGYAVLMPKVAWAFSPSTPQQDADGLAQGAVMTVGKGRIAVFGEAGMFTAQDSNGQKFGFNAPDAPQNKAFILNVARWLAGKTK